MKNWNVKKAIVTRDEMPEEHRLAQSLSWPHLIALGVGAIVGTGILTLTGVGAAKAGPAVILSFVVVIDRELVGRMASVPIERAELARSTATAAPRAIATSAVVEHGLRHLAWLAKDDPVVAAQLPAAWRPLLAEYLPEPFKNLG